MAPVVVIFINKYVKLKVVAGTDRCVVVTCPRGLCAASVRGGAARRTDSATRHAPAPPTPPHAPHGSIRLLGSVFSGGFNIRLGRYVVFAVNSNSKPIVEYLYRDSEITQCTYYLVYQHYQ